jgi:hypothetical protein
VANGEVLSIHGYCDPRPMLSGTNTSAWRCPVGQALGTNYPFARYRSGRHFDGSLFRPN